MFKFFRRKRKNNLRHRKRKNNLRHVSPRAVAPNDRHRDSIVEFEGISASIAYRVAVRDKGGGTWEFRLTRQNPKRLLFAGVVEDINSRVALSVGRCFVEAVDRYSPKDVAGTKETVWFWGRILALCITYASSD